MQRLNSRPFLKPQRTQPMPFAFGHSGPVDGAHNGWLTEREMVELHAAYLQPIRNNIKGRFGLARRIAQAANET